MALTTPRKLWEHPSPEFTEMARFQAELERSTDQKFKVIKHDHSMNIISNYIAVIP